MFLACKQTCGWIRNTVFKKTATKCTRQILIVYQNYKSQPEKAIWLLGKATPKHKTCDNRAPMQIKLS